MNKNKVCVFKNLLIKNAASTNYTKVSLYIEHSKLIESWPPPTNIVVLEGVQSST